MKRSDQVLHVVGSDVVGRRAGLMADDGVTILVGPRWSGTRAVAMGWMARQAAPDQWHPHDGAWDIVDLTAAACPERSLTQSVDRWVSGELRALLILGRSVRAIRFDSLRARTVPRVVGPRDLRLSCGEIAELALERGRALDGDRRTVIHDATGGWLRLVTAAIDLLVEHPTLSARELELAVHRDVLRRTGPLDETQLTMLLVSPFWDTEMVQLAQLRENTDEAAALLDGAETAGLVWSQLAEGGTHHVLEPLAAAVRAREAERGGADRVGTTHRRLVGALCERGRLVDATRVALARDDPAAVWLAARAAIDAARWDLLVAIAAKVSAYPPSWFGEDASEFRILVTLASRGRELPFSAWHDVLQSASRRLKPTAEDSLRSCLALVGLYQATGDIERAMQQARTAVQLSGPSSGAGPSGVRVMALRSATEAFLVGGSVESAYDAAARALAAARQLADPQAIAAVTATAELSRSLSGDLRAADVTAEELEATAHIPNVVGSSYLARALTDYEHGDVDSARRMVAQARAVLDETDLWWLAAQCDAVAAAHAGHLAEAELINREIHRRIEHGWVVSGPAIFAGVSLAIELLLGRPTEVLRRFDGRKLEFPAAQVMKAAAHLALRQDDRALRVAQPLTGDPIPRVATLSRLVAAVAAAHEGRSDLARTHAELGFQLIRTVGLKTAVRYLSADSQQVVATYLDAGQRVVFEQWCARQGSIQGAPEPTTALSPRERELIAALGSDRSLTQIADDLRVSRNTVKTLTQRIYRKLGVTSRPDAVDLAQRRRLI